MLNVKQVQALQTKVNNGSVNPSEIKELIGDYLTLLDTIVETKIQAEYISAYLCARVLDGQD